MTLTVPETTPIAFGVAVAVFETPLTSWVAPSGSETSPISSLVAFVVLDHFKEYLVWLQLGLKHLQRHWDGFSLV